MPCRIRSYTGGNGSTPDGIACDAAGERRVVDAEGGCDLPERAPGPARGHELLELDRTQLATRSHG